MFRQREWHIQKPLERKELDNLIGTSGNRTASKSGTRSDADGGWGQTMLEGEGCGKAGFHPTSGGQLLMCLSWRIPVI